MGPGLTLLFLWVPKYGVEGAIRGLLVGEFVMALLNLLAAARLGYRPQPGTLARAVAGAALGGGLVHLLRGFMPMGFIGSLAATAILVALGLLATRAATLDELRGILKRRA